MKTQIVKSRYVAIGTLGAMTLATLAGSATTPAQANAKTWKKAAIGAAAVTGYGLLKHNGKATTLGAIGTAGSYYMYKRSKKKEKNAEARRQAWYHQRYGSNWRSHYRPGN